MNLDAAFDILAKNGAGLARFRRRYIVSRHSNIVGLDAGRYQSCQLPKAKTHTAMRALLTPWATTASPIRPRHRTAPP